MTTPSPDTKHAFSSTRKLPLGQIDKSLNFCDRCGERVNHPNHDVSNQENLAAIVEAIEHE